MGLIEFAKTVGRKLGLGDDDDKKVQGQGAQPGQHAAPTPEQVRELHDRRKAAALAKVVQDMGFKVDELGVRVDDDKVTLTGQARTQEDREKIVLLVGNHEGIGSVDDKMTVAQAAPEAVFYVVEKGDTLSKIAKHYYGDANKYHQIFEANKPMLEDPDKIYPGQRLRIPGATHA
ncbi:MAG TPA: peptidoglycan-binding protein LysM [Thermoanaerobaculia bacterium]|jgi:nucleoid-associated protein YgaU|nr:peptidoglycan-binding protein LysM [Thermoanaerobaculia bacterium]